MPENVPAAVVAQPADRQDSGKKKKDGYRRDHLVWADLFWRVQRGEPVSLEEVIAAIRARGVPAHLGSLVADWLTQRPRGKGRPQTTAAQKNKRHADAVILSRCVRALQAEYKRQGKTRPRERALDDVAEAVTVLAKKEGKRGIGVEALKKRLMSLNKPPSRTAVSRHVSPRAAESGGSGGSGDAQPPPVAQVRWARKKGKKRRN